MSGFDQRKLNALVDSCKDKYDIKRSTIASAANMSIKNLQRLTHDANYSDRVVIAKRVVDAIHKCVAKQGKSIDEEDLNAISDVFVQPGLNAPNPGVPALFSGYIWQHFGFADLSAEVRTITAGNGVIPKNYLFAHALSYETYLPLLRDNDYSSGSNRIMFRNQCKPIASKLKDSIGSKLISLVSLGVGLGEREQDLIYSLVECGMSVSFVAIDLNPEFITAALSNIYKGMPGANGSSFSAQFIVGDFDRIHDFAYALPKGPPMVFLALGGTFGNQDETKLLHDLRQIDNDEKYILLDYQTEATIQDHSKGGYDIGANKAFVKAILNASLKDEMGTIDATSIRAVIDNAEESLKKKKPSK